MIAASAEIGYAKPNKKIFERAFEIAGCCAEKSVMVGDRLDNDMIPAKALGMKTVWIRKGLSIYQSVDLRKDIADWIIDTLSDLRVIFS